MNLISRLKTSALSDSERLPKSAFGQYQPFVNDCFDSLRTRSDYLGTFSFASSLIAIRST